jgi:RNA polymerase sigma-70 factor (ECF subfamily)
MPFVADPELYYLLAVAVFLAITPISDEEKQLIRRAAGRDEQACNRLLNLYKGRIFSYVYRVVRNYHDAEEITYETFIRCFKSLDNFDVNRPLCAWLFSIAHNLTIDHFRKNKQEYEYLDESHAAPGDFVEKYETKKKLEKIEAAIQRLPALDREIVILFHKEDLSYDEIAGITKLPVTTVKTRLHRARKKLAEMVKMTA